MLIGAGAEEEEFASVDVLEDSAAFTSARNDEDSEEIKDQG